MVALVGLSLEVTETPVRRPSAVEDEEKLLRQQSGEGRFVDVAFHGMQVVQHARAISGIGGRNIEHPVFGFGSRDHDFIGPTDNFWWIDGALSKAAHKILGHGSVVRRCVHDDFKMSEEYEN